MTDSYLNGTAGGCLVALLTLVGIGVLVGVGVLVEGLVLMLAWNLVVVGLLHLTSVTLSLVLAVLVAAALHVIAAIF